MPQRSLTVGTVQVTAVCDVTGDFPVPLDQAFPGVEAAAWAPWRRRHPDAFSGHDRWRLRDWCFVVRARERVVLVDTGVGGEGCPAPPGSGRRDGCPRGWPPPGSSRTRSTWSSSPTCTSTTSAGTWPGTATGPGRGSREPATWSSGPTGSCSPPGRREDRAAFDRCVAPLQSLGVAELLDGDRVLDDQLSLVHSAGHTPARRACWSAPATTRPCSGATSPTAAQVGGPTGGRAATSSPRWPEAPGGTCSTASRARAHVARPGPLPRAVRHRDPGRGRPPLAGPPVTSPTAASQAGAPVVVGAGPRRKSAVMGSPGQAAAGAGRCFRCGGVAVSRPSGSRVSCQPPSWTAR